MTKEKPKRFRIYADGNPVPYATGLSEEKAHTMVQKYKRLGVLLRKVEE